MKRWFGFFTIVFTLGLCFTTSTLQTPLYPLYQQQWQLPPSQISYIFSAYMLPLLLTLVCFGRLSDTLGRQKVILMSLFFVILGLVLSAVAKGAFLLIVARVFTGIGNGLLTTSGVLALAEAHPRCDRRISSVVSTMAISLGFALGPFFGGALAEMSSAPLITPYLVVAALGVVAVILVILSGKPLQGPVKRMSLSIRPQMALPSTGRRGRFLLASMTGFSNFTIGALFASLVPSLIATLVPWTGPLILGALFIPLALGCAVVQLKRRDIEPYRGLVFGMALFACSFLGLIIGLQTSNGLVLLLSLVCAGTGQGYTFMSSAVIATQNSDEKRRAANMSTFFFFCYTGATAAVAGIGRLADYIGLLSAVVLGTMVFITLFLFLGWQAYRYADEFKKKSLA